VALAVTWGLFHRNLSGIRAIGVDEIQWHRGHKYLTLVYQIENACKRLLWIGADRTTQSLEIFFELLGKQASAALRFVSSDMWQPYLEVVSRKAAQAVHVLDRFHIMARMNKAIDLVRAQEATRLKLDGHEPILKHSRWCLLKRPENLTDAQAVKLKELMRYNLKTVRAYLQREDFQRFWEYSCPRAAGRFLREWCTRVMRSRIEPLQKIAKSLRKHQELVLNWFRASGTISAAVVEGLNNKVKVTIRRSYGFRSERITKLALYHVLGALPEPAFTHRFW
jgi:transposase